MPKSIETSIQDAPFAEAATPPSRSLRSWLWWLAPVLLVVTAVALTTPPFTGDSIYYCEGVVRVLRHLDPATELWEPGHILWRPLAYFCSPLFFSLVPDNLAWTPVLKIAFGLTLLNVLSAVVSALLIYDLSKRLMRNRLAALIPVMLFVWGDGVLAYTQASTAYVAGFAPLMAGIWWQLTRRRIGPGTVTGAAILFAGAALIWLPYIIAIPAACCARRFFTIDRTRDTRMTWRQVLLSNAIAGALVLAGLALAMVLAGIHSFPQWTQWMIASGHGSIPNRRAMRAVTGSSRLFLDQDTMSLKRYLFHDPYHPVTALGVVVHSLWKPAVFYVLLAAVLLLAWQNKRGKQSLVLLAIAVAPALVAAIGVFEPSSPERFFPVLPFLLLSVAAGWESPGRPSVVARAIIGLFALLLPAMNAPAFIQEFHQWQRQATQQTIEFRTHAAADDAAITIMLTEPLMVLSQHPFNSLNRMGEISTMPAIDIFNAQAERWPRRVAQFVSANWAEGRFTWVEKAALSNTPAEYLRWVEGENPKVHWKDVPAFFHTLEFDRDTGGADGFLRISPSPANKARLKTLLDLP